MKRAKRERLAREAERLRAELEAERARLKAEAEAEVERLSLEHHDADSFEADQRLGAKLIMDGRLLVERVEAPSRADRFRSVWPVSR